MRGRRVVTLRQEQFHIELGLTWQIAYDCVFLAILIQRSAKDYGWFPQ